MLCDMLFDVSECMFVCVHACMFGGWASGRRRAFIDVSVLRRLLSVIDDHENDES